MCQERNSKDVFLYKWLPEKIVEHTNNAAEIIFSLFSSQYKAMKEFRTPKRAQAYRNCLTLRYNFRIFSRGKQRGLAPVQVEGLSASLNDRSEFLYPEDETSLGELLFLSRT